MIYIADIIYGFGMRALVDIQEQQIEKLDALALRQKRSRAALIREAVSDYLDARAAESIEDAFGLWGNRKVDGLEYQQRLRSEW